MMIFTTILIISEIIFFIGFLFFLKSRFEKKFLTAQIKHELEELVTSFNRQAEINILTIDKRLEQARALVATLEESQKTLLNEPNKRPESLPLKATVSKSQKRSTEHSTSTHSTGALEKPIHSTKKITTTNPPISAHAKPSVSVSNRTKRTKKAPPPYSKPDKKTSEQRREIKESPAQQPVTRSLSPKPSRPQKVKVINSIQKKPTLNQQILKLAEENHSLTMIAHKLDIPLNEVRLRLELQRSNIQHFKHTLQRRLSN